MASPFFGSADEGDAQARSPRFSFQLLCLPASDRRGHGLPVLLHAQDPQDSFFTEFTGEALDPWEWDAAAVAMMRDPDMERKQLEFADDDSKPAATFERRRSSIESE